VGLDIPSWPGAPKKAALRRHGWVVVQQTCRHEVIVPSARLVRNGRTTTATKPHGKALGAWEIETIDQSIAGQPSEAAWRNENIRRVRAAGSLLTSSTMAISKAQKRRFDPEPDRPTQATSCARSCLQVDPPVERQRQSAARDLACAAMLRAFALTARLPEARSGLDSRCRCNSRDGYHVFLAADPVRDPWKANYSLSSKLRAMIMRWISDVPS
jgi:hypothetical protein